VSNQPEANDIGRLYDLLDAPIYHTLRARIRGALTAMGIKSLSDFSKVTEEDFFSHNNFGKTCLRALKKILTELNVDLLLAGDPNLRNIPFSERLVSSLRESEGISDSILAFFRKELFRSGIYNFRDLVLAMQQKPSNWLLDEVKRYNDGKAEWEHSRYIKVEELLSCVKKAEADIVMYPTLTNATPIYLIPANGMVLNAALIGCTIISPFGNIAYWNHRNR
jgi:hypothetical protein